jgi:hypothetical protein
VAWVPSILDDRIFHNLRASRQTELEETFPSHVVCQWIGNSPQVARKHYLQVTDDHIERAIKRGTLGAKVAQKAAQQAHALSRKESQKGCVTLCDHVGTPSGQRRYATRRDRLACRCRPNA